MVTAWLPHCTEIKYTVISLNPVEDVSSGSAQKIRSMAVADWYYKMLRATYSLLVVTVSFHNLSFRSSEMSGVAWSAAREEVSS